MRYMIPLIIGTYAHRRDVMHRCVRKMRYRKIGDAITDAIRNGFRIYYCDWCESLHLTHLDGDEAL